MVEPFYLGLEPPDRLLEIGRTPGPSALRLPFGLDHLLHPPIADLHTGRGTDGAEKPSFGVRLTIRVWRHRVPPATNPSAPMRIVPPPSKPALVKKLTDPARMFEKGLSNKLPT